MIDIPRAGETIVGSQDASELNESAPRVAGRSRKNPIAGVLYGAQFDELNNDSDMLLWQAARRDCCPR